MREGSLVGLALIGPSTCDALHVGKGKNKAKNKAKAKRTKQAASAVKPPKPDGGMARALWSSPRQASEGGVRSVLVGVRELDGIAGPRRTLLAFHDPEGWLVHSVAEAADDRDFERRAIANLLREVPSVRFVVVDDEALVDACPTRVEAYFDETLAVDLDEMTDSHERRARAPDPNRQPGLVELGASLELAARFYAAAEAARVSGVWAQLRYDELLAFEFDGVGWAVHLIAPAEDIDQAIEVFASLADRRELIELGMGEGMMISLSFASVGRAPPAIASELAAHGWAPRSGKCPVLATTIGDVRLPAGLPDVLALLALLELLVALERPLADALAGEREHAEVEGEIEGRRARLRAPHPGEDWLRDRELVDTRDLWLDWVCERSARWSERERSCQRELVEAFERFMIRADQRDAARVRAFVAELVRELPIEPRDLPLVVPLLADWIAFLDRGRVDEQLEALRDEADALSRRGSDPSCFSDGKRIQIARKSFGIASADQYACWAFERGWRAAMAAVGGDPDPEASEGDGQ